MITRDRSSSSPLNRHQRRGYIALLAAIALLLAGHATLRHCHAPVAGDSQVVTVDDVDAFEVEADSAAAVSRDSTAGERGRHRRRGGVSSPRRHRDAPGGADRSRRGERRLDPVPQF